jgi:hypothetical protein
MIMESKTMLQIDLYPEDAAELVGALGVAIVVFNGLERNHKGSFKRTFRQHIERLVPLQQQITLTYNEVVS